MGKMVVNGAKLECSFGAAKSPITVLVPLVKGGGAPAANIMDNKPMANIMPFGVCKSMANPAVAAATSAAMGTLTPQPCTPMTATAPWAPGHKKVKVRKMPALDDTCQLVCMFGGAIKVSDAGQTKVTLK